MPSFLYGSHYSNAGIVMYYLLRFEPYASLHVEFQAGKFDFPDRLFYSIGQTWKTCLNSLSCYKELTPEFFYCFPVADHQLLTSRGFLYHAEVKQWDDDFKAGATDVHGFPIGPVMVACPVEPRVSTGQHSYGITFRPMVQLVDVAQASELVEFRSQARSQGRASAHIDLQLTGNHTLPVLLDDGQWEQLTASAIVDSGASTADLLFYASEGAHPQYSVWQLSFVRHLSLQTLAHIDAFVELYGYWIGHGSWQAIAVTFKPNKPQDWAYLDDLLDRLGIPLLQNGTHARPNHDTHGYKVYKDRPSDADDVADGGEAEERFEDYCRYHESLLEDEDWPDGGDEEEGRVAAPDAAEEEGEEDVEDPQRCWFCGDAEWEDGNEMLLCDGDGCDSCGHVRCARLRRVPAGDWYCPTCADAAREDDDEGEDVANKPSPKVGSKRPRSSSAGGSASTAAPEWGFRLAPDDEESSDEESTPRRQPVHPGRLYAIVLPAWVRYFGEQYAAKYAVKVGGQYRNKKQGKHNQTFVDAGVRRRAAQRRQAHLLAPLPPPKPQKSSRVYTRKPNPKSRDYKYPPTSDQSCSHCNHVFAAATYSLKSSPTAARKKHEAKCAAHFSAQAALSIPAATSPPTPPPLPLPRPPLRPRASSAPPAVSIPPRVPIPPRHPSASAPPEVHPPPPPPSPPPSPEPELPDPVKSAKPMWWWVWHLDARRLRLLLRGLRFADGNQQRENDTLKRLQDQVVASRERGNEKQAKEIDAVLLYHQEEGFPHTGGNINTSSSRSRDQYQRIALLAGFTSTWRRSGKKGDKSGDGRLTADKWHVYYRVASLTLDLKREIKVVPQASPVPVWCVEVPEPHLIVVRRVTHTEGTTITGASRPTIMGNSSSILDNINGYDLGLKQDGELVNDVVLPAWAADSAEFIRIHRLALESEYVSQNLHHWVDLIFGYKQKGKAAIDANNVFFHLTYEGAVDLSTITDPVLKNAVKDQIALFGQTPLQLFKKPHPARGPPLQTKIDRLRAVNPQQYSAMLRPDYHHPHVKRMVLSDRSSVVAISMVGAKVFTVSANFTVAVHWWNANQTDDYVERKADGSTKRVHLPFTHALAAIDRVDKQSLVTPNHVLFSNDGKLLFEVNNWDDSLRVYAVQSNINTEQLKLGLKDKSASFGSLTCTLMQHLRQHKGRITCVSLGRDDRTLVTGSTDCTLLVWQLESEEAANKIAGLLQEGKTYVRSEPKHRLRGHEDEVVAVAVQSELDVCVSVSARGLVLLHSLRKGWFLLRIRVPTAHELRAAIIASAQPQTDTSDEPLSPYPGIEELVRGIGDVDQPLSADYGLDDYGGRDAIVGVRRQAQSSSPRGSEPSTPSTPSTPSASSSILHLPSLVRFTVEGHMIFFSRLHDVTSGQYTASQLSVCTVNGRNWRAKLIDEDVSCMALNSEGKLLALGGVRGGVCIRRLHDLKVIQRFEPCSSQVASIAFSVEQEYLFVSTVQGALSVLVVHC